MIGGYDVDDLVAVFDGQGRVLHDAIRDVLGPRWDFAGKRVLDFGCGAGRVLRHFVGEATRAQVHGCDIDAASIAWVAEALDPPIHGHVTGERPPLPFTDGSFDLIWTLSVFSHLTRSSVVVAARAAPGARAVRPADRERHGRALLGADRGRAVAPRARRHERERRGAPVERGRPDGSALGVVDPGPLGTRLQHHRFPAGRVRGPGSTPSCCGAATCGSTPPTSSAPRRASRASSRPALHSLDQLQRAYGELNAAHDAYAAAYASESERRSARSSASWRRRARSSRRCAARAARTPCAAGAGPGWAAAVAARSRAGRGPARGDSRPSAPPQPRAGARPARKRRSRRSVVPGARPRSATT